MDRVYMEIRPLTPFSPRSLTRETEEEEEEEYDDGYSKITYECFLVWRDEGTYRHSYCYRKVRE